MMLFNIKQSRWRSVVRQEFEQRSELLLGAVDRRRMMPIENNVLEILRHGAARRRSSRSVCEPP